MDNSSKGNSTLTSADIQEKEIELMLLLIPNTVILFLFLFFGFVGNAFIFLFYTFNIKDKKGKENRVFIKYLSGSDLLASTLGSSLGIVMNIHVLDFENGVACTSLWFLTTVSVFCSGLLLVVIAIHRFLMVCRPHGNQMNLFWKRLSMICVLICSIVISFPTLFLIGKIPVIDTQRRIMGYTCGLIGGDDIADFEKTYKIIVIFIGYGVISIMSVLYFFVGRVILKQLRFRKKCNKKEDMGRKMDATKNKESSLSVTDASKSNDIFEGQNGQTTGEMSTRSSSLSQSVQGNSKDDLTKSDLSPIRAIQIRAYNLKEMVEDQRFSIMFVIISVVFVLSYSPRSYIMIQEIIDVNFWTHLPSDKSILLHLTLYRMYILNNVCNPFIYGAFDKRLRQEFKKFFVKWTNRDT